MNKKKKELSIDELAIMIQNNFDEIGQKMKAGFKQTEKRFNSMESRLTTVEKQVDGINRNQKELIEKVDKSAADQVILKNHEKRIKKLEKVKLVTIGLK